eukprot:2383015-Pyramimonas_sp.AAC.1
MDASQLAQGYNARLHHSPEEVDLDPQLVISRAQVASLFSQAKRRKAAGRDGVRGDILRGFPAELARLYHPVFLKASVYQQEPLCWKHGTVYPLFKGSGNFASIEFYRSILLNSTVSKCWHRFLRSQVSVYMDILLRETQCGGRPRRGPSVLVQTASTFLKAAQQQGCGAVLYFVDLTAAFYSVVRSLVLPLGDDVDGDIDF